MNVSSSTIELAETKTYIELTNRLCYYGEPNLNSVMLPIESAEEKAQSLVNQPVVAKYKVFAGKPDLGGHEMMRTVDGVKFGTETVGTHTAVEIREDTVEVNGERKTLPCLFAKCRVWKRNENVVNAVKRLFSENRLHSSWEILVLKSEVSDNVKVINDYIFEGNALLGTNSPPAYGDTATAIALAEKEDMPETLIAEALANDINQRKENEMETEIVTEATTSEVVETPVENTTETEEVKPSETSETSESGNVTESPIEELSERCKKLCSDLEERNAALSVAAEQIKALNEKVSELEKYKVLFDESEAERLRVEAEEKRKALRCYSLKSGLITEDELESSEEIKALIDNADETGIHSIIAQRFMKSLDEQESVEATSEVSTVGATIKADVTADETINNKEFMQTLLGV